VTRLYSALLLVGMSAMLADLSGCTAVHEQDGVARAAAANEEHVLAILGDLWTLDNDIEHAAIVQAQGIKDHRLSEALVAKLCTHGRHQFPAGWYVQELLTALQTQGVKVDVYEYGYLVHLQESKPLVIPYREVIMSPEELGRPWVEVEAE